MFPRTRHTMLRHHALALLLLVAAATRLPADDPATPGKKRPNILFIAVDDLRPELGCYGTRAVTPHLDRLAASGLKFDRAYCNQAVCGASRVSLMTGLYPEHTGERTYHVTGWRKRWATTVTLNQHFTQNGYTTIGLGKIYHGKSGAGVDPDNWTQWVKVGGKEYGDPDSLKNPRKRNGRSRGPATDSADIPDTAHFDGNRARIGATRLKKLAKSGKPFFLAVGFTKPHLPFTAPRKYWDLYKRSQFRLPKNLGIPPGYPQFARNRNAGELRSYKDIPLQGTPDKFPVELSQRLIHGYHACASYTDRNVGVLLEALKTSGAADNTIVVFWADHGWKLGDHSSWCKHTNFECDTRVPLIIHHPRMPSVTGNTDALVELIDLYPTLCDLCGLDRPKHLQGKSLVPVLKDPSTSFRRSAYSSYPHGRGRGRTRVVGHSIRTDRHRYTEWWDQKTDKPVARVLTDITADPGETTSVTDRQPLQAMLSGQLRNRVLSVRKPKAR